MSSRSTPRAVRWLPAAVLAMAAMAFGCTDFGDSTNSDDASGPFGGFEMLAADQAQVFVHRSRSQDGEAANISGELIVEGGCLLVRPPDGGDSVPVVWPSGTRVADESPLTLELPIGGQVTKGDVISGGGGFYDTETLRLAVPARCLPPTGEVAVLNPMGVVEVDSASASDQSLSGDETVERCIEEPLPALDPVGSVDTAAYNVEHLLPPPLRTSGPISDDSAILLGDGVVGEVVVERVTASQYQATAFNYCVPAGLNLDRIDIVATLGGTWELTATTPALGLPPDTSITLTIDDQSPIDSEAYMTGDAVCNQYQAIPDAGPDGAFRLTGLGFTEQECVDAEIRYQDVLRAVDAWTIDDGDLLLSGPQGELRYAPAGP